MNENRSCTYFTVRYHVNYVNENTHTNIYIIYVISDNSKSIVDKEISLN